MEKRINWILQVKDHFSKFCWAKPLERKEAREVSQSIRDVFFMFGPPKILQSDNGREFVNELINSLQSDFPGYKHFIAVMHTSHFMLQVFFWG